MRKIKSKVDISKIEPIKLEPTELEIQRTILDYLKLRGIVCSVTNADRSFGKGGGVRQSKVEKGWPDISGTISVLVGEQRLGLGLFIEVKRPSGTLSDDQRDTLSMLDKAGAVVLVARSLEDVEKVVRLVFNKPWTTSLSSAISEILRINLYERRTLSTRKTISELLKDNVTKPGDEKQDTDELS